MHVIKLNGYNAITENGEKLELGTFDSYGEEQLQIVEAPDWVNLRVIATFNPPNKKPVQVAVDSVTGVIKVPKEATADLYGVGTIVFVGLADGVQRISADVEYIVRKHSNASGTEPAEPTPDLLQQVLTLSKDAQTAAKNAEQSAKNAAKDAADTVKPYKEEAVRAATAAALSEKNAAESKTAAQEAAERATQAGIAASNAAEEAERSAGIATDAAGSSALDAENARKSAQNAQQSANNAAESQSAAAASADAAAKSQQSAAIDAKTASDAKVAAAGNAEAAAGSANAAENSASAAAGSERAAGASEVKAAESEKAAKTSEQAAAESAQAALESKTAAATSEVNAAASAKKAQDVADSLPEDYTTAVNDIATLKQQVANITPDDSTIGENPWSSKHIIDMLCPPLEESGNPVVCYPVAGYPLGVKAKWEPVQEGSGTPSPENIRPIKGRDSVTVERCGENILNPKAYTVAAKNGITFTINDDKSVHIIGTATGRSVFRLFSMKYKMSLPDGNYALSTITNIPSGVRVLIGHYDKNSLAYKNNLVEIRSGDSFATAFFQKVGWLDGFIEVLSGSTIDTTLYPMLVLGKTAPTTYTPYIGQTNTLTLPETVYGGEVDAVSGDGNENTKIVTLDGTTNMFRLSDGFWNLPQNSSPGIRNGYDTNCSHFPPGTFGGNKNKGYLFTKPQLLGKYFQDVNAFNAYLAAQYAAGTPVQVSYKLAEPVPFTATGAKPLPALVGVNTVLTDADSVTVMGRADPIKRIEDLEAAVASIN